MGLILFLKHGEGHTQLIFSNFEVSFFEVIEIEPQQYDEKLVEAKQIRILTILSDFTIRDRIRTRSKIEQDLTSGHL